MASGDEPESLDKEFVRRALVDAGGEPSPNGNTVSIEDELVRQADAKRQFDLSLYVYQSGLSLLRTSLGRR